MKKTAVGILAFATACVFSSAQEVACGVGDWPAESGLGNHRAVIRVEAKAAAVRVRIPWRRRDFDPEKKNVVVIDAATGGRITNVLAAGINREFGDIVFQPGTAPGDYYAYYLPYQSTGRSNYPTVKYDPPSYAPDPVWLERIGIWTEKAPDAALNALPQARVIGIQSIDAWNSFYPMEVIATADETRALLAGNPGPPYLLFPEDRTFPIRMTTDLPYRWISSGPRGSFIGEAARGEYYAFQIGIYAAHERGFKVKIYDTIRELSNRAAELFALRSLGHEIFSPGPGGGFSWLQEHLGGDYIAAWFVPELQDAAVINSGMSRWHNYYIEGLDWLAKNVGIDGLYLDDVAFDRTTMKRVRKVLDRNRPGALIDLHSANQFNPRDGFASSANLYLEHFPFLNRLWFGEYFDYDSAPDYWLVEVSGIPFGIMGEMLQDGGNPWRGMLFGMTSRLPWAGDPRPLWKAWDEFGIRDAEMIGFWVERPPVKTGRGDVPATVYVKKGQALISIASWAKNPVTVRLDIDWKQLGINPAKAQLTAPAIESFQDAAVFKPGDAISVMPGKGWLLVAGE